MTRRRSAFARQVRHPDRAEMRCDSCGAEAIVKNGLHDGRSVFNVIIDREGKMWNGHAVMSVMLRVDAGVFLQIVHGLGKGIHEVVENPGTFGRIEILGLNEVEFGEGCKLGGHASERSAAGVEAGLDVGPVVDGDFAGLIKGFAAGEFLSVPRRGDEAGFRRFNLRPQVVHGLDLFFRSHAVNGFHYGWHIRYSLNDGVIIPKIAAFVTEVDKSELTLRETVATLDQLCRAKLQEYFG